MVEQNVIKWIQSYDTLEPGNLRHLTLCQGILVPPSKGFPLYYDPPWYTKIKVFYVSHTAQLVEYI